MSTFGRALPMILARSCVKQAVNMRQVAHCSGRSLDMERDIERRICKIFNLQPGRVTQGAINFELYKTSTGDFRAVIDEPGGYYDSLIPAGDAAIFIQRHRDAYRACKRIKIAA